jgi:cation:H+ antiporter
MLFALALALVGGLVVLIKGADLFVDGAAATARYFRVSPLVVGMLVVGFGTSAPEMLVSAVSAIDGAPGIALGNAWGSNIANIALILGITALVKPVTVQSRVIRTELPILLVATGVAGAVVFDGILGRIDAIVLLALFALFLFWSVRFQRVDIADPLANEAVREVSASVPDRSVWISIMLLVVGLVLLVLGSRGVVWGAVGIARAAGISDLVIGLTVVAVGTSLPELASSIAAVRKGEDEIAFGNIVGSNMFNTLAVVGIAGVIAPFKIERVSLVRDLPVMAVLTLLMLLFGIGRGGGPGRINRYEATFLCLGYAGYLAMLVYAIL